MTKISFFKFLSRLGLGPSPKKLAAQLRRPSGFLAKKVGDSMNISNSALYDFALDTLQLADGDAILEIGFGNGKTFPRLFSRSPGIRVTGLDFSPDMVKQARRNNAALLQSGRLKLVEGVSNRMPFPDHQFDKIFCINVLYFWDNPQEHLREVRRVLKPGGTFYPFIRSKESMQTMPFTQFGFLVKEEKEWLEEIRKAGFEVEVLRFSEPEFEFNGQVLRLQSLCLKAQRQSV